MIDRGNFVVQNVAIGFVEVNPFPDHCLIVRVHRNAARVENAWTLKAARLDFKHVVPAISIFIDPIPDRIAQKRRFNIGRPITSVGIDSARVLDVVDQDIGGVLRNNQFDWLVRVESLPCPPADRPARLASKLA